MIVSQLNRTELHRINSIKVTLNRLTMMLCDDSHWRQISRQNILPPECFHNFSLSACPVFTAAILQVHFDSAILDLCLFYFVIPIRKSGLVCTFESEIRDFPQPYFNFSLSKNRTMGAKCNRLSVHLAADQQALMLVCFQTSLAILPIFITTFFSNFTDFFLHFQNSLTLEFFSDFPDPQTGIGPLYTWGPPRHLIWQVKTTETELINFFCRQQFSIDSFWSMPFLGKNKIFRQVKNLVCCFVGLIG